MLRSGSRAAAVRSDRHSMAMARSPMDAAADTTRAVVMKSRRVGRGPHDHFVAGRRRHRRASMTLRALKSATLKGSAPATRARGRSRLLMSRCAAALATCPGERRGHPLGAWSRCILMATPARKCLPWASNSSKILEAHGVSQCQRARRRRPLVPVGSAASAPAAPERTVDGRSFP